MPDTLKQDELDNVLAENGSALDQEEAARAFAEAAGEEYKPPIEEMASTVEGGEGADTVASDDTIDAGEGADTAEGGSENDSVENKEPETFTKADLERVRFEEEQRHIKRIRDLSGEIGGLKQKLGKLETARAAADESGNAPTSQQIRDAATNSAKMTALKDDFPEIAEALEEAIAGVQPQNMDEINARLEAAESLREQAESTASELDRLREVRRLDKTHPDWEEVIASREYNQWLKSQSQEIQYAAESSVKADDAIKILNWFKADVTSPANPDLTATSRQNQDRLEKATSPTSGRTVTQRRPLTAEEAFEEAVKRTMGG